MPALVPSRDRIRENAHHLTQQLPVEGERKAQGKRQRQDELSGPLLLEGEQMLLRHLVERGLLRLPARAYRGGA